MKKRFNITGLVIPKKHYFAPIDDKIAQIFEMIEYGDYFVINKPRQYGKTTTLSQLKKFLNKRNDYLCISISFEGISDAIWSNEEKIIWTILNRIIDALRILNRIDLISLIINKIENIKAFDDMSRLITELISVSNNKIVLIIDEVDNASNHKLFINFLAMLRKKYLSAQDDEDNTFQSVVLAGVHDIKNLKEKIRGPEGTTKYNSPWNIAAKFNVDMELSIDSIKSMLLDYKIEKNISIDEVFFAENIYYWTSGYPFLVSAICKILDEVLLPEKENNELTESDFYNALKILLSEQTTNFESLIKNIENDEKVSNTVRNIIFNGKEISFSNTNPVIEKCMLYGILKNEAGHCKVHNHIYEQVIYEYFENKHQTDNGKTIASDLIANDYFDNNGELLFEKLLLKFQSVIREKYADSDVLKSNQFLHNNVRLLFFVFLQPVINGKGFAFKEVETGAEKRMDVLIIYNNKKYIVELKVFRGEKYHQDGLEQLNDYLCKENVSNGYLLIFNKNKSKDFRSGWLKYKDKDIFELWF